MNLKFSSTDLCLNFYLQEIMADQDLRITDEQEALSLEGSCRLCADCNQPRRESPPGPVPYWDGQTGQTMHTSAIMTFGAESEEDQPAGLDEKVCAMPWEAHGEEHTGETWPQILAPVPRRPFVCVPFLKAYGHEECEFPLDVTALPTDDDVFSANERQSTPYNPDGDALMAYPGCPPLKSAAAAQVSVDANDKLPASWSATEDFGPEGSAQSLAYEGFPIAQQEVSEYPFFFGGHDDYASIDISSHLPYVPQTTGTFCVVFNDDVPFDAAPLRRTATW